MVPYVAHEPWPNSLDLAITIAFLSLAFLLPALGFVFMALDLRTYLRSLRRSLAVVARTFSGIPDWAHRDTPRAIAALGLRMPCSEEDLKRAYRRRVQKLHPDHGGDQRRFLLLQAHFEEALAIVASYAPGGDPDCPSGQSAA
jgi:hypothetical protein